jgi:hypothetical protein
VGFAPRLERGENVERYTAARDLVNEPAATVTPVALASDAQAIAKKYKGSLTVRSYRAASTTTRACGLPPLCNPAHRLRFRLAPCARVVVASFELEPLGGENGSPGRTP